MNKTIDTQLAVCNTIDERTPGADSRSDDLRRKRKTMKERRHRQHQRQKEKKREARQQRLQTPRQQMTKMKPAKRLSLSLTETKSDRVQIQFRIGSALVEKIDRAAASDGCSRNDWLIEAVRNFLENGDASGSFNSVDVSANRIPILFRVGSRVRDEIDRVVAQKEISNRTMWILDAILAALDKYDFS